MSEFQKIAIVCLLISTGFVLAFLGFVLTFYGIASGRVLYFIAPLMAGIAGCIAATMWKRKK